MVNRRGRQHAKHKPVSVQGNLAALPPELGPLMREPNWVVWKWEPDQKKPNKFRKVPYRPSAPHHHANTRDRSTWGPYEEALAAVKEGGADGIGFCLTNTKFAALDLDNCRDPDSGQIASWAEAIVGRAGSYTEVSVSGTGLHIIGLGSGEKIPDILKAPDGGRGRIECYSGTVRYITMSGFPLPGSKRELADISGVMRQIVEELSPRAAPPHQDADRAGGSQQIPQYLSDLIIADPKTHKDHSGAFHRVVCELRGLDFSVAEIEAAISGRPIVPHRYKHKLRSEIVRSIGKTRWSTAPSAKIIATPFKWIGASDIPLRDWLYGTHLIRGYVSLTVAPSGVGKSSLAIAEALSIASGKRFLHDGVPSPLSVWLWNGEDPKEELERRILAAAQKHGLAERDIAGRLFVNTGRDTQIRLAYAKDGSFKVDNTAAKELIDTIRQNDIDVVIIDPFISSHEVSENDNLAMDRVVKAWERIAQDAECAVHLVHHTRKVGKAEVEADHSRGAGAAPAAARSVRTINQMTPKEAKRAAVQEPRAYIRLDDGKVNLAPPARKARWLTLESVDLRNGANGSPGDQVGVVSVWHWPQPKAGAGGEQGLSLSDAEIADVQKNVEGGFNRKNAQAKFWVGQAVARIKGLDPKRDRPHIELLVQHCLANGFLKEGEIKQNGINRPVVEVAIRVAHKGPRQPSSSIFDPEPEAPLDLETSPPSAGPGGEATTPPFPGQPVERGACE